MRIIEIATGREIERNGTVLTSNVSGRRAEILSALILADGRQFVNVVYLDEPIYNVRRIIAKNFGLQIVEDVPEIAEENAVDYLNEGATFDYHAYPWATRIMNFRESEYGSEERRKIAAGIHLAIIGYGEGCTPEEQDLFAAYVTLAMLADSNTAMDALFQVECYTNGTY